MASDEEFVRSVQDQVRSVGDVSSRKRFGESAVYVGTRVVALVCDNQVLLKPTDAARALPPSVAEAAPYPGAKPYVVVAEYLDARQLMAELIRVRAEPP